MSWYQAFLHWLFPATAKTVGGAEAGRARRAAEYRLDEEREWEEKHRGGKDTQK